MKILNEYRVSDEITTSRQPTKNQFEEISTGGHEVVINLAMPDHENSIGNEGEIVTSLGMAYIHIPVPFDAPTEELFEMFCTCMDALAKKNCGFIVSSTLACRRFCFGTFRIDMAIQLSKQGLPFLRHGFLRWTTFGRSLLSVRQSSYNMYKLLGYQYHYVVSAFLPQALAYVSKDIETPATFHSRQ